jgi:hypothetical protein
MHDALLLYGDDNQLIRNKITNSANWGIDMRNDFAVFDVTGNLLEKNVVLKSGTRGIYIGAGVVGNTFVKNKVLKSGEFDLFSVPNGTLNTFEDNKFGEVRFE